MPNRIIKESAFTSDKIAELNDFQFRLWIGLITQADDAGRGDARPAIIKGRVFALRERVTIADIAKALDALAAHGCVDLYEIGGQPYYVFPSWEKHQRIRNAKPKYPAPDNSRQLAADGGESRQLAANCGEPPQPAALIQSNPIQSESKSESESESSSSADDDIARIIAIWNELPDPIPKIWNALSESRLTALQALIDQYGADTVTEAVSTINYSTFLTGQSDKSDWHITFDWFLKPDNFLKVADGNYTDMDWSCI